MSEIRELTLKKEQIERELNSINEQIIDLVQPVIIRIHKAVDRCEVDGQQIINFNRYFPKCECGNESIIFSWCDSWGDGGSRTIPIELVENENKLQEYCNEIIEQRALNLLRRKNQQMEELIKKAQSIKHLL